MNLIDHFKTFLQKYSLEDKKLLLLVSGGVDSMVLLHICAQVMKPQQITVFHLNHKTRKHSDSDALFVQNYCSKLNIHCIVESLDKTSIKNKEASWRKERQQRAQRIQQQTQSETILTAHHATDLVETMIHRLTKGCGVDGLSPFDTTTKPFWNIPKQMLVDYAQTNALVWREDESNDDTQYERNLLRKEVIPHLRKITPHLEQIFVKESELFSETSDYLQAQTELFLGSKTSIPLEEFLHQHIFLQKNILRSLSISSTSQNDIQDCLKWLHNKPQGGSTKKLGQTMFRIEKNHLCW